MYYIFIGGWKIHQQSSNWFTWKWLNRSWFQNMTFWFEPIRFFNDVISNQSNGIASETFESFPKEYFRVLFCILWFSSTVLKWNSRDILLYDRCVKVVTTLHCNSAISSTMLVYHFLLGVAFSNRFRYIWECFMFCCIIWIVHYCSRFSGGNEIVMLFVSQYSSI